MTTDLTTMRCCRWRSQARRPLQVRFFIGLRPFYDRFTTVLRLIRVYLDWFTTVLRLLLRMIWVYFDEQMTRATSTRLCTRTQSRRLWCRLRGSRQVRSSMMTSCRTTCS